MIFRMDPAIDRDEHPSEEVSSRRIAGALRRLTVGVFAKHWTPGATKTRLAASIGDESAAKVSRCLSLATLERLSDTRLEANRRVVAHTPSDSRQQFADLVAELNSDWQLSTQADGDLGDRMRSFLDAALKQGSAVLLFGTDSPDMPLDSVIEAAEWLMSGPEGRKLVLGPTDDGGYWCIGARGCLPPIFDEMPWSQPELLRTTLDRLGSAGWCEGTDYRMLAPWYDVDEAADLRRLRDGLRQGDRVLQGLADEIDALLGPA